MWFSFCRFIRKLSLQVRRERFRRELVEEIATHEAFKFSEYARSGVAPREAATKTRLDMGNIMLAAEKTTDVRTFISFEELMQDFQYALRLLRKNFGFSLMAIASLALGIGGSTAVFSM